MLVSHRKKFIYTKTVKTAGTSVESYFERYCMAEGEWEFTHHREQHVSVDGIIGARGPEAGSNEWYNHMPAVDIRNKVGQKSWDNYFKFCVIRNPFDRLVSMFFFRKEKGLIDIKGFVDPIEGFKEWITKGVPVPDREQYEVEGNVCIDYFIRYENIEEGIKFVCDKLAVPFEPARIPRLKAGIRDQAIDLRRFYSEEIIQSVQKLYEFEINEFGYDCPC